MAPRRSSSSLDTPAAASTVDGRDQADVPRGAAAGHRLGGSLWRPSRERRHRSSRSPRTSRTWRLPPTSARPHLRSAASEEDIPGAIGRQGPGGRDARRSAALAQARGRPVEWAVSTVADARSYSASEALEAGAVDGIAASIDEVLADANGRPVEVSGTGTVTLDTRRRDHRCAHEPVSIPALLSDPNIAFLLFVVGALGWPPSWSTPTWSRASARWPWLLAFIGFGSLPLNLAGLLLAARVRAVRARDADREPRAPHRRRGSSRSCSAPSVLYTGPITPGEPVVAVAPRRPRR